MNLKFAIYRFHRIYLFDYLVSLLFFSLSSSYSQSYLIAGSEFLYKKAQKIPIIDPNRWDSHEIPLSIGRIPQIKLPYKKVTNSASVIALVSRLMIPLKNRKVTNPYIIPLAPIWYAFLANNQSRIPVPR